VGAAVGPHRTPAGADRGPRRTAISYLVFAHADSLGWLFAARIMAGFFGANVSTAFAYIADVTTPQNRARAWPGRRRVRAGLHARTLGRGELTQVSIHLPGYVAAGLSASSALFDG
jgi:DHA1 family tetracycline resistance protein-like MFS transporter